MAGRRGVGQDPRVGLPLAASSVVTALIAAGASLLGVLIGGAITLRTQKASLESAREDELNRERRAARAAWLLLRIEVGNALDAVYEIRRSGRWPIGWHRTWSAAWRDSRDKVLGSPPSDEDLRVVASACARIDELENGVNTGRAPDQRDLGPEDQVFLWRMQQELEPACEALGYRSSEERPRDPTPEEIEAWSGRRRSP
jgi:hypothetical protein